MKEGKKDARMLILEKSRTTTRALVSVREVEKGYHNP